MMLARDRHQQLHAMGSYIYGISPTCAAHRRRQR
jgi:hypothetical protein